MPRAGLACHPTVGGLSVKRAIPPQLARVSRFFAQLPYCWNEKCDVNPNAIWHYALPAAACREYNAVTASCRMQFGSEG
jgi:hypothetical protein